MKKTIFLGYLILLGFCTSHGQTIRRIKDEAIVSQKKRMVFQQWGDFRPYGRWFLGIQTNFSYATVWGMWAPNRNRRYKRGQDIRPLSADGEETLRGIEVSVQKNIAEDISDEANDLYNDNAKDFQHWNPLQVDADPLWILYYNQMLSPLKNFPDEPSNATEWGLSNSVIFQRLVENGDINILKEQLDILKEKYNTARNVAMPRGKRILLYHETLLGWRLLHRKIKEFDKRSFYAVEYGNKIDEIHTNSNDFTHRNDKEIVEQILEENNFVENQ